MKTQTHKIKRWKRWIKNWNFYKSSKYLSHTKEKHTHNAHKNIINKMPNQKYKRKQNPPIARLLQVLELLLHMKCGRT